MTLVIMPYVYGLGLLILGIILLIEEPLHAYLVTEMTRKFELVEGTLGLTTWKEIDIEFRVYLFHVTNPEKVMQGEAPLLVEYGPYVYNQHVMKKIVKIDEAEDGIEYEMIRYLRFNEEKSGNLTGNEEITVLNSPYLGTIQTIANSFASFMKTLGDQVINLFPGAEDVFLRCKAKELIIDGIPLVCDKLKFPKLSLMCSTLEKNRLPILRQTDTPGRYLYSLFDKLNASTAGPFTVNRGVVDPFHRGDIMSYRGSPYSPFWNSKNCSKIVGSDANLYGMLHQGQSRVFTYILDVCRSFFVSFKDVVIVRGILGHRFESTVAMWDESDDDCYCPRNAKKVQSCPPKGLLDLSKCQGVPVAMSEPHFLHADPELLKYARGLRPDERFHSTYVVVDPETGAPLCGFRMMQLNMYLGKQPVQLLRNVSEGYFPMVWIAEGVQEPNVTLFHDLYQAHRLLRLFDFFPWIPVLVGGFVVLAASWLWAADSDAPERSVASLARVLPGAATPQPDLTRFREDAPPRPKRMFH